MCVCYYWYWWGAATASGNRGRLAHAFLRSASVLQAASPRAS